MVLIGYAIKATQFTLIKMLAIKNNYVYPIII